MKKRIVPIIIALLIVTCTIGLSACNLFGGGTSNPPDSTGDGTGSGVQPETTMETSGDIPFNLDNDFYFQVEMKSTTHAETLNPISATFTAIRMNDTENDASYIHAVYTYYKYKNQTEYQANNHKEKYVEERVLYEGVDYRKSSAQLTNSSGNLYDKYTPEEWNTKVPAGTTMSTTIEYIRAFLNGNHIADTPYKNEVAQTTKIPSDLSTVIHNKGAGTVSGSSEFKVYNNGTESMTFARFENNGTVYNEQANYATVTKYRGAYYDADVANVKVWGNIVVSAVPVEGKTVMKKTISAKFSSEVTQETFDAVLANIGFVDPVLPVQ